MTTTQLLIGGRWTTARSGQTEEVCSPFDGSAVGEVPVAGPADVELALAAAERGAAIWRRTPAHERMRILLRAAQLADERAPRIAATLSAENGKTITEATTEAGRSGDLIRLSAFEGTQLYGDTLPLDANRGTGFDKLGFTVRQPVGVVVAITAPTPSTRPRRSRRSGGPPPPVRGSTCPSRPSENRPSASASSAAGTSRSASTSPPTPSRCPRTDHCTARAWSAYVPSTSRSHPSFVAVVCSA